MKSVTPKSGSHTKGNCLELGHGCTGQAALLEETEQVAMTERLASGGETDLVGFTVEQLHDRSNLQRAGSNVGRNAMDGGANGVQLPSGDGEVDCAGGESMCRFFCPASIMSSFM